MELDLDEDGLGDGFTAGDVEEVIGQLIEAGGWVVPTDALVLGQSHWRPDLVSVDRSSLLHVHMDTRLRSYVVKRLGLACQVGMAVHVALQADLLYDEDVLRALSRSRASVVILQAGKPPAEALLLLRVLAQQQIKVPEGLRRELGREGWLACRAASLSAHQKGRSLEALLAFLLGEVSDFRVVEYNLRTATEELDLVIQVSPLSGQRCWVLPGTPFVLVEAKNWTSKVGQPEASLLHTKVVTKRRTVRIAFLVGANGFTEDADLQVLKLSLGPEVIVLLGPDEIARWIEDGEDYLENRVRHAMLR